MSQRNFSVPNLERAVGPLALARLSPGPRSGQKANRGYEGAAAPESVSLGLYYKTCPTFLQYESYIWYIGQ